MSPWLIVLLCVLGAMIIAFVVLYFLGKKTQTKKEAQEEEMKKQAQPLNFFIIDMKKMRLKNAGLPKIVYESSPKLARLGKVPVLKVKAGNRVMSLVCDAEVYKTLLPKMEVKAQVSGIYVISAKRIRGPVYEGKKKKGKDGKPKESFIDRLR